MTDTQITPSVVRTVDGRSVPAPGRWVLDPAHTSVEFVARHLVVSKTRGRFTDYDAVIEIGDRPEDSTLDVTIRAASISSGDDQRDGHLRSPDLLDVEAYPTLRFTSTSVTPLDGARWAVRGDFTVRDITKPLTLEVTFAGETMSPWGTPAAFFSASAEFDREDWGLSWNQPLANGGVLVGKKVTIEIDAEAAPAHD